MASWIGLLQARGLDPDLVLPEPLLLPAPDHGFFLYDDGELPLLRSQDDAFSIEPELVEIVIGDQQVERLDRSEFEAGLAAAIADSPVNLRQGAFAKRRRWKIEWPLLRRLAGLAVGILVATLLIQVVYILRYTYAADALEAEADRVASAALRRPNTTNASAQLGRRVAELGGSGARYAELAPAIFAAVRDTPMVELSGLQLDRSGSARVTVQADSPASLEAFQTRLRSSGLGTVPGPLRTAGGRPTAEIMVSAQ
jgi:general secretion pathway protein L